jgi:hypothetical protein
MESESGGISDDIFLTDENTTAKSYLFSIFMIWLKQMR